MRLTPLDIRKQEFKKAMRGLDTDEVYAFLSTVADEYEAVLNDNKALRERLIELDDKVAEYRNMEKTLRDTLLTAERVTVEAKDNAQREANLVIKEAQIEAEKSVREIKQEAMNLRNEIQNLKRQRESYLARMKMLVESHMKFLETAEADFAKEEKAIESEIRKWADEEKTTPKKTGARKPVDPASASARTAATQQPASPSQTPGPATPATTPAAPAKKTGELPPSTASAPVESTQTAPPPPGDRSGGKSVTIQGQTGSTREQEIRRLLDRMTSEHEPEMEQTPGGTVVATLTETAEDAVASESKAAESSEEEPDKWSLERLRQDILARSTGKDEKD